MLRRLVFIITLLLSSNLFYAQIVTRSFDTDEFQTLLKSELNVILTGKEEVDTLLKEAVRKYWQVTDYKFITKKEALYAIKDEKKTFMFPMKLKGEVEGKPSSYSTLYKFWMTIVIGGKSRLSKYNDNNVLVLSPLGYWSGEKNIKNATYRFEYIIKGMNDAIEIVKDRKITTSIMKMPGAVIKQINLNARQIKDKTLIINQDAQFIPPAVFNQVNKKDIYKEKDFKKNYPYKYQFVNEAEYLEILNGNSDEYLCLMTIIEINKHIHIYDPSTRETVYYGFEMKGHSFKNSDMTDLRMFKK